MQTPSMKVVTQFLVAAMLLVVQRLLSDTAWVAWLPDWLGPYSEFLLLLLAAVVAYLKAETNPAMSSFRFRAPAGE